ncbi:MAG: carboxypeptidase-like regulatory domain-containing protein [Bacteroidales bacterium]|nr:carboxypeptidase-like regulatory domain-containing protein [Bacteroidales bacterium]
MNHAIRILLLIFAATSLSHAQVIKGKITSQSGDPIAYSTVYIQELKQGTTSNTKGYYEIKLSAGQYTVMYQSLGFEPVIYNITLTDNTITKDIRLQVQYYQIPEVRISASGEDPAYGIMRKAIGLAPYYLNNISYYKANVYLKGNLVINKIPRLMKRSLKIEAKNESGSSASSTTMKEGDAFLMESINEIEFTAPDKYVQKVISYNSTFPEEGNEISPMEYVNASFYQPIIADMAISPLAPNAFSHYNFKYLGATPQGNYTINKIQVIPKRKSQQLLEGTIYIIDDLWCLQSVDLTNENLVGKIRVQQLYIPVEDGIWMPVSDKFEINIGIIGFRADAGYAVSVKYDNVKPNLSLPKPKIITGAYSVNNKPAEQAPDSARTKTKKQIDKLLEKEELSNRDMVKLSRLMAKESEKSVTDSAKKSLEIRDNTTQIVEKDAAKKDSAYWAEIRPIPLSDIEIKSLHINDSIRVESSLREAKPDTSSVKGEKGKSKFFTGLKNIGLGHSWSDTTGTSFTFGGIIDLKNLSFNTVDGLVYGLDFRFSRSFKQKRSLTVNPDIKYAFSRQQLMWRINANYQFSKVKQMELFLRMGMTSKDIGNGGGINPFLNTVTTLMFERNYLKLYESDYLTLGYRGEIANGLNVELTSLFEMRKVLENTTDFTTINTSHEYSDNIPDNSYLSPTSNPVNYIRNRIMQQLPLK